MKSQGCDELKSDYVAIIRNKETSYGSPGAADSRVAQMTTCTECGGVPPCHYHGFPQ